MKIITLDEARKEAIRFLDAIDKLDNSNYCDRDNHNGWVTGGKLQATVKRRSMDLSNVLVKMRQE